MLNNSYPVNPVNLAARVSGNFYDEVTATDVAYAYQQVEKIAEEREKIADFKALLAKEMMKQPSKDHLREVVVKRLKK